MAFLVQLPTLEPKPCNLRSGATQPIKPLKRTKRSMVVVVIAIIPFNSVFILIAKEWNKRLIYLIILKTCLVISK